MNIQIILSGIGGQGVLFLSRIFSELGLRMGVNVLGSETHGMSQRGGSVICHLKLGEFQSPLIRTGAADLLYCLDRSETYRVLKFLKAGGVCFSSCVSADRFEKEIVGYMKDNEMILAVHDAVRTASESGSARAANVTLIGYSVGTGLVPYTFDAFSAVLKTVSRKNVSALNLKAFEAGYRQGLEFKAKIR